MTPLLFALMLMQTPVVQTPPATPPPAVPQPVLAPEPAAAPDPVKTPAETLQGLEEVYSTTCGQTGILYSAYADLCDGLSRQIRLYRIKVDKEQAKAARAAPAKP